MALDKFQVSPRSNLTATTAPTVSDDSSQGYSIGSLWINTTTDIDYTLVDATVGAAVWSVGGGIKGNPVLTQTQISALEIDWAVAGYFYKDISATSAFTFANAANGMQVTLYLKADGTNRTVSFPTCAWVDSTVAGTVVTANTYNVYSFVKINNVIFASVIEKMGVPA